MPAVSIPTTIALLSPAIVTFVSGILSKEHYPQWINAMIAGFVIILVSFACAFYGGTPLTHDMLLNFVLIASYASALTYGPLQPLHKFLRLVSTGPVPPPTPPTPKTKQEPQAIQIGSDGHGA